MLGAISTASVSTVIAEVQPGSQVHQAEKGFRTTGQDERSAHPPYKGPESEGLGCVCFCCVCLLGSVCFYNL